MSENGSRTIKNNIINDQLINYTQNEDLKKKYFKM